MALHLSKVGRACWRYPLRLMELASFRCDAEFGPLSASQRTWLDLPLGSPCSE
jgi:hypothetical protein